jgi:hypothetical protein
VLSDLAAAAPNVGIVGVLVATILAVFRAVYTGGLVPRQTHQDVLDDRDQWREAHSISEQSRQEQKAQVDDLLELARTTNALLGALNRVRDGAS